MTVSAKNGLLSFADRAGSPLLRETDGRSYDPTLLSADGIDGVTDRFFPSEDEGIYGLGQHQSGVFNYRGSAVYLSQINTDVAVPFFISTRGYGLLWNAASTSLFDNRYPNQLNLVASARRRGSIITSSTGPTPTRSCISIVSSPELPRSLRNGRMASFSRRTAIARRTSFSRSSRITGPSTFQSIP